jgi:ribose transport system substrate-binding protein
MLMGQHPKLSTIMIPLPKVSQEDLPKWSAPCFSPDTTSLFPIPPSDPVPPATMSEYFLNPEEIPVYDYDNVPDPCEWDEAAERVHKKMGF